MIIASSQALWTIVVPALPALIVWCHECLMRAFALWAVMVFPSWFRSLGVCDGEFLQVRATSPFSTTDDYAAEKGQDEDEGADCDADFGAEREGPGGIGGVDGKGVVGWGCDVHQG
jgi:hypothetical protein